MTVSVRHLFKTFGGAPALNDVSVEFRPNSISVLLGPSGCGKTTLLRCLAGIETPDIGQILIENDEVFNSVAGTNLPPERRQLGMVFQSYAIWPHMTVAENVALPLRERGMPRGQADAIVNEMLKLVSLDGLGDRNSTRLSGGQQQRVSIARALAYSPRLILLDEPLSNLDAKLRVDMRRELKALQRKLGQTMVFVTHDQEEAMSLADEIHVFDGGKIVQSGSGTELYYQPANRFVANFLGRANFIPACLHEKDGRLTARSKVANFTVISDARRRSPNAGNFVCMVRPEAWQLGPPRHGALSGHLTEINFIGGRTEFGVDTPVGPIEVIGPGRVDFRVGDIVGLSCDDDDVVILD